ncbi:uncharacterized protein LOC107269622 isoform X2 [Cephus cinctus]|uniref:Uncharacterized protein LOC107269622 isoform X2 n=1 Tax=Cephus cinctus TaxID=211228 RepID=A0AAJ7RL95_CEPCN|nr:uncharacterized protein LOC107269622 isoform X2 [Cephus cinctus]
MKFCVSCIYCTLLFVFFVSSGLLFLIVTSEGVLSSEQSSTLISSEDFGEQENVTKDDTLKEYIDSGTVETLQTQILHKATSHHQDNYMEKNSVGSDLSNFETPHSDDNLKKEQGLDILAEIVTQQPNLSQGILETGQSVVLTLVDTAAAELQSLADPRISSEFHGKSLPLTNVTLSTSSIRGEDQIGQPASSETSKSVLHDDQQNETIHQDDPVIAEVLSEAVVTVRAHQKPGNEDRTSSSNEHLVQNEGLGSSEGKIELKVVPGDRGEQISRKDGGSVEISEEEELAENIRKVEADALTTAPELNDSAARARLVGEGSDEAAAVIMDGLVASGSTDPHEDIPSFSEWAQRRLEEAEKKKTHPNASIQNPGGPTRTVGGMKVRSKNYASPDCGAKIVAVNPEARSAKSVLASTRDEYMLNTCTSRVWFVVELCEAIQAKKIELANFELFSSSPKDFSVFVSDRFPTRDWSPVGQFTAKDERDIQSFPLHPQLFGKFIKVELHSHYGAEHFCPISLFRAYGTSEFEVLETETESDSHVREPNAVTEDDDEDDEENLDGTHGEPSRNLFGSARDAVLSIVKKAAEVLVKSGNLSHNNITKIQENIESNILESSFATCITPRYTIVCNNCTDKQFARVFQLISCRGQYLDSLIKINFVKETLRNNNICTNVGATPDSKVNVKGDTGIEESGNIINNNINKVSLNVPMNLQASFLSSVFPPECIMALCNVLATNERKLVLNVSYEALQNTSDNALPKKKIGIAGPDANESATLSGTNGANSAQSTMNSKNSMPLSDKALNADPSPILQSTPSDSQTMQPTPSYMASVSSSPIGESRHKSHDPQENVDNSKKTQETLPIAPAQEGLASQIKPTRTLSKKDPKRESSAPVLESSKHPPDGIAQPEVLTTPSPLGTFGSASSWKAVPEDLGILDASVETVSQMMTAILPSNADKNQGVLSDATANAPVINNADGSSDTVPQSMRTETSEQEVKQQTPGKVEPTDQDVKDQLSFDTLLSDLKDFEGDSAALHNNPSASSASVSQPAASYSPQQKESVFLRLSNRIKALERNMSLSGQYLEELSRRYKKQVEEMQRSLERAVAAMGEESRKTEDRELKRLEEIELLKQEVLSLSESVKTLLYDRDSWRDRFSTIGQHLILICIEITVVVLILSYCRRSSDLEMEDDRSSEEKEVLRRKSVGDTTYATSITSKSKRNRRPSEIASKIIDSYQELMMEHRGQNGDMEKKKKRKRKRDNVNSTTRVGSTGCGTSRVEPLRRNAEVRTNALVRVEDITPGGRGPQSSLSSQSDGGRNSGRCIRTESSLIEKPFNRYSEDNLDEVVYHDRSSSPEIKHADDIQEWRRDFKTMNPNDKNSLATGDRLQTVSEYRLDENIVSKETFGQPGGILKSTKLSSPSFMKTALEMRNKRRPSGQPEEVALTRSDWGWYSKNSSSRSSQESSTSSRILKENDSNTEPNGNAANGRQEDSDEASSGSSSPTRVRKDKKSTGLKKMT